MFSRKVSRTRLNISHLGCGNWYDKYTLMFQWNADDTQTAVRLQPRRATNARCVSHHSWIVGVLFHINTLWQPLFTVAERTDRYTDTDTQIYNYDSALQCVRRLGPLHPHKPRGWNVAVPALVLVFSLITLGIYTTRAIKNKNVLLMTAGKRSRVQR